MVKLLNKLLTNSWFQRLINKNSISRFIGRFADRRLQGFILRPLIKHYIKAFAIDMNDYDYSIAQATTFNDFFTRKLKPEARTFGTGICASAEGFWGASGAVVNGQLFQIKGSQYALSALVGNDHTLSSPSSFHTIYLSPGDYHRVHAPIDMKIEKLKYFPGTLHSVSWETVRRIPKLFCQNERIVLEGTCPVGRFYFVFVGAIAVGRIRLSFSNIYSNNKTIATRETIEELSPPLAISKGEELGYFEMGSTVIMILEGEHFDNIDRKMNSKIYLGESIVYV